MANSASPILCEKPFGGRRIVVTRARKQAGELAQRIEALGGEVIEFPTIEIQAPASFDDLDGAVQRIDAYHWIMFTSVNSVEPFLARLKRAGKAVGDLHHAQVAAIGSETAKRLSAAGVAVAVIPSRYQAEGILESLKPDLLNGRRVLIPRAAKARDVLPETLREWGATVDVVEAYQTVAPAFDAAAIRRDLQEGSIDMITFTSSSTVNNFLHLCGAGSLAALIGTAAIASIGPITAKTIEELGGRVAVMAREFTIDGLIAAMIDYFTGSKK
jgi:uroporphyrinogen III methyltransferase / synthase